eukprot:403199-Alexandrium_andersonii.AAC.1
MAAAASAVADRLEQIPAPFPRRLATFPIEGGQGWGRLGPAIFPLGVNEPRALVDELPVGPHR